MKNEFENDFIQFEEFPDFPKVRSNDFFNLINKDFNNFIQFEKYKDSSNFFNKYREKGKNSHYRMLQGWSNWDDFYQEDYSWEPERNDYKESKNNRKSNFEMDPVLEDFPLRKSWKNK